MMSDKNHRQTLGVSAWAQSEAVGAAWRHHAGLWRGHGHVRHSHGIVSVGEHAEAAKDVGVGGLGERGGCDARRLEVRK